jgi:hypothetical protein
MGAPHPPKRWIAPAPVATGRGGTRHRAVSGEGCARHRGAGERRGGACERCGGDGGRHIGAFRTLEEEEAGLLQFEVSSAFPMRP